MLNISVSDITMTMQACFIASATQSYTIFITITRSIPLLVDY